MKSFQLTRFSGFICAILFLLSTMAVFAQTTFGSQEVIVKNISPSSIYIADLDGDGDTDVISASYQDDEIGWYANDGASNFGVKHIITTVADGALSVYAADLDGDGDTDVLSASYADDKIAWYENDGAGNFGLQQIISPTADGASSVSAADLDGDGDLDVLSASRNDDKIAWYENDGDGNFGMQQIISTVADGALSVYAADLDGDGDTDVLSASYAYGKIAWYENDDSGNFGVQQIITIAANDIWFVSAADLDGDGDLDVLFNLANNAWFENDGLGNFIIQEFTDTPPEISISVYVADLDGDGDLDVLSTNGNVYYDFSMELYILELNSVVWYENDGLGNFISQYDITQYAFGAHSVYAADLDGDGDQDVISGSFNNSIYTSTYRDAKIAWYENDGLGNFIDDKIIAPSAYKAYFVYAADLDGDGDKDVLSGSYKRIAWYENDGIGNFGPPQTINKSINKSGYVYIVDLDSDGDFDVLSAFQNTIVCYENDGAGNFEPYQIITAFIDNTTPLKSVHADDIDEDGDIDVLATYGDNIVWFENDGFGYFSPLQIISTANNEIRSVCLADLNGDGDLDLISAFHSKIAWYKNEGAGIFGSQEIITSTPGTSALLYTADLDGDGDIDVLLAYGDYMAWLENDGFGNFGEQQIILTTANHQLTKIFTADLDNDGDIDIMATTYYGYLNLSGYFIYGDVEWYENDGTGNFSTTQNISGASNARDVYAADLNGDGDLDALFASNHDDRIAWKENLLFTGIGTPDVTTVTLHIVPTPTQNTATLIYTSPQTQPITIYLYDLTGRLLHTETLQATLGTNNYILDMTKYSNGLYLVTLNNGVEVVSGRVVKE